MHKVEIDINAVNELQAKKVAKAVEKMANAVENKDHIIYISQKLTENPSLAAKAVNALKLGLVK